MTVAIESVRRRLQKLECTVRNIRNDEQLHPIRELAHKERRRWVLSRRGCYVKAVQRMMGSYTVVYNPMQMPAYSSSRIWNSHLMELRNFCLDVECAIRCLAFTGRQSQETDLGRQRRLVFILRVFEDSTFSEIGRRMNLKIARIRALWENSIEHVWDSLSDYRNDEQLRDLDRS